jgi:hypothetical protein
LRASNPIPRDIEQETRHALDEEAAAPVVAQRLFAMRTGKASSAAAPAVMGPLDDMDLI